MPNRETQMSLPPRWGDDSLTEFIQRAHQNVLATFVHKSSAFGYLLKIDRAFLRIGENLLNPSNPIAASLLLRSHSAFRAACRLAMSGQAVDTFPSLRACLEYAMYALHIDTNEDLAEIWFRRHDSEHSLREMKKRFRHVEVARTLEERDASLHSDISKLYERTIDFGGHPNERAISGSATITRQDGRVEIQNIYLHEDSLALDHVLRTTAQVGVGSLMVLRHVFKQRFDLLGIRDTIDELGSVL